MTPRQRAALQLVADTPNGLAWLPADGRGLRPYAALCSARLLRRRPLGLVAITTAGRAALAVPAPAEPVSLADALDHLAASLDTLARSV